MDRFLPVWLSERHGIASGDESCFLHPMSIGPGTVRRRWWSSGAIGELVGTKGTPEVGADGEGFDCTDGLRPLMVLHPHPPIGVMPCHCDSASDT